MSTQRLFFALWPDDPVRARLRAAARELAPRLRPVRSNKEFGGI